MSESNERIIPIRLEGESSSGSEIIEESQELMVESEKSLSQSLEQLSVQNTPKKPNVQIKTSNKTQEFLNKFEVMGRHEENPDFLHYSLPNSNCAEKIFIVIDRAQDDNYTPFTLRNNAQKLTPLAMIKRSVNIFLTLKHDIDTRHEFSIIVLNENDAKLLLDFTSDMRKLKDTVNKISECVPEDIFDMGSLFEILCKYRLPKCLAPELGPLYILRTVIFWGRSYTIPKLEPTEEIKSYLEYPFFTCDFLMTHEPLEGANNCEKIFKILQNVDKKGTAYFFPVSRDMRRMQKCCARLLGHPLQRPVQKLIKS